MNHKRVRTVSGILTLLVVLALAVGGPLDPLRAARLQATTITFTAEELLGKPTDTSVTVNIVPQTTIEYHYQYGTTSGALDLQTANYTATGGQPHEIVISGLTANTRYYYRMRYHLPGETDWVERTQRSFWTQRAAGSTFVFTVTSDAHGNAGSTAMTNILNELPDFNVDLGDTFMSGNASSQSTVNTSYLAFREPTYFDRIGHSIPIFLAAGNHEDEEGWNLDDTPFSPAVGSIQARKAFYPTPIDEGAGGFYSGNTDTLARIDEATYGDEYREDYYAWEWGDALFVVIDPFQYTMLNPYGTTAGEGADDPATGDQWNWTLGAQQFNWLKQTLENSNARFKFVFSHQMVGGIPRAIPVNPAGYVRGGAEAAGYFEWGGKNADGSAGFAAHRAEGDFGTTPIHQLMVENGVSAYFHGHDHGYVYEKRGNIVYQEVPSPSMTGGVFSGIYTVGTYADYETIAICNNSGHLRITVTPSQATVDYVRSGGTASCTPTSFTNSYTIQPNVEVNDPPVVSDIPDQAILQGGTFATINLDNYVSDPDNSDAQMTWSYSGNSALSVSIVNRVATITTPNGEWTGAETIQFTATDPGALYDSDSATFTVAVPTTLTAGNDGNGSVSPASGTYPQGTTVTLTPQPNSGYTFTGWVGANGSEVVNTGGVYTILMTGDKSVTANFSAQSCSSVSLDAVADTYLYEYDPVGTTNYKTWNYGGATTVVVNGLANRNQHALLTWDLSGLPAGVTISAASITLQVSDATALTYNLYNMRRTWVQGTSTGASSNSSANWNTYNGTASWGTIGARSATADHYGLNLWTPAALLSTTGSREVPLNSDGLAAVQGWYASPATNYGATIQNYNAGDNNLVFSSLQGTTPPRLNITYCTAGNHAPTLENVEPPDNAGNVNIPKLSVNVADADSNVMAVTFYGREAGAGALGKDATSLADFSVVGTFHGIDGSGNAYMYWSNLKMATEYEWYAVVTDGAGTTTGPTWSFTTGDPTAARLTSFGAAAAPGGVRLAWDTASEAGSLGFHVWRATSADGERVRVTAELIASQAPGSTSGGHYEWVDEAARPGVTYSYWLEQVGVNGATQLHGPVSARAEFQIKLPPPRGK